MPAVKKTYEQSKYWLVTDYRVDINYDTAVDAFWTSKEVVYSKGQLEAGALNGTLHWQFTVCFKERVRKATALTKIGNCDAVTMVATISKKTLEYVCKDETSQGRRWEWGKLPFNRARKTDYDRVRELAIAGDIDNPEIPSHVYIPMYRSLTLIAKDHMKPVPGTKEVNVYWGDTGLGKSRKAWAEATFDAYPKTPTTKFWDGYQGQEHVVIDEFFGQIEISHMLRWLDRYPVTIENKGSGTVLRAKKIWITSNIDPLEWYQTAPPSQVDALMRRMNIVHFTQEWFPPQEDLPTQVQSSGAMSMLVAAGDATQVYSDEE